MNTNLNSNSNSNQNSNSNSNSNTNTNNTTTSSNTPINTNIHSYRSFIDTYLRPTPTTSNSKNKEMNSTYRTFLYNLDSSISKDFNSIYTDFICSILLKNDCVLFGDFVIEFFSHNILNFSKVIYAYGDIALKNVIERDLYGKIYTKQTSNYPSYGYIEYKYKCLYNNHIYDIIIYFLNYVQKMDETFIKENMPLNIDTLTISEMK